MISIVFSTLALTLILSIIFSSPTINKGQFDYVKKSAETLMVFHNSKEIMSMRDGLAQQESNIYLSSIFGDMDGHRSKTFMSENFKSIISWSVVPSHQDEQEKKLKHMASLLRKNDQNIIVGIAEINEGNLSISGHNSGISIDSFEDETILGNPVIMTVYRF
jgi:hypothetical protein